MTEALEAGYDLSVIAACYVAIAFLSLVVTLAIAIRDALNISIAGLHPFSGIASALNNSLIKWLNDAISGVEKVAARFTSGLIDSFGLLIAIPVLLYLGVKAALSYLWHTGLVGKILFYTNPINDLALAAKALYGELAGVVSRGFDAARSFAESQGTKALAEAQTFTTTKVAAAVSALRGEYAASVSDLEKAINTATDGALQTALNGVHAAESAASAEVASAESSAASALAQAQAIGQTALDTVKSIAVTAEDDLATIEGGLGALGVAGLIAAIPAISTLVHAIATESGLENADCRSKVKGICGTDPSAWAQLLGGLAALGFAFSLKDLYDLAEPLVGELAPVIAEAL